MKFATLASYFSQLEQTASRNQMTEILAQLLGEVPAEETAAVCYLALGRLRPLYESLEFSLAEKMVVRSVAELAGKEGKEVWKEYKRVGDLGDVTKELLTEQKNEDKLSILEVYRRLEEIALDQGEGSQERKRVGLANLLKEVSPESGKYIVRMVLGKLRLGFSDKTLMDALAVMKTGNKSARSELERAYQVFPNIGRLAEMVKESGIQGIAERVQVELGVPVMPALCQRLKTAEEMIKKMGKVMVEPKFDGTRVQIHIDKTGEKGWKVKTFTRNLEETTPMFPELLEGLDEIKAEQVILDSEAIGFDPKTGKLLPFQETITRKRKHGIAEAAEQVPLKFFVFDVLFVDGQSLIDVPLDERKQKLDTVIGEGKVFAEADVLVTQEADVLRDYHAKALADGLEGVVIKQYQSPYEPGRRGWSWVKFKEVEEATGKLSDTIDAVVLGFYRGRGKRAAFGIGAFLIGVRDEKNDTLVTIAKIGTGLSDDQWKELRKRLEESVRMEAADDYRVDKQLEPDVWVDPKVVVEVAADEITRSPIHTAGLALRFPRLVRFRDDKSAEQTTTLKELKHIA